MPVHEGRAVLLGEQAGFYELDAPGEPDDRRFAANLLDAPRAPSRRRTARGRRQAPRASSRASTSACAREIWIYLLLAAALLTALEWATYHRRMTV